MAQEDEAGALRKMYQELQAENAKLKAELKRHRDAFDALKRLVEVIQAPINATIDFANLLTSEMHAEPAGVAELSIKDGKSTNKL